MSKVEAGAKGSRQINMSPREEGDGGESSLQRDAAGSVAELHRQKVRTSNGGTLKEGGQRRTETQQFGGVEEATSKVTR